MRKVLKHTIETADRDKGKTFVITEMSARAGHRWATKAIFGLLNSGVEIPDELRGSGMAGIAVLGIRALSNLPHAIAEPLLDEMLDCAQIELERVTRPLVDEDIEEVKTFFVLQQLALTMHIEPFISGGVPTSESNPTTQKQTA